MYKNFLYIASNKYKLVKIDYNLENAYKNLEEDNQISSSDNLTKNKNNLKRTHTQTNSNEDTNVKRYKILDSYLNKDENETSESINGENQKFNDNLLNNIYNKLSNNTHSINNSEYEKIYDNHIYFNQYLTNQNNDYNLSDLNKDSSFLNYHDNKLDLSHFFKIKDNNNNNNYNIFSGEDINSSNQFNEMENEYVSMEESSEVDENSVFNPCNDMIQINYDMIQRYIKLDEQDETKSIHNNSVSSLKECYSLSNAVHKKIKKLLQYLNNKNMIFNYLTVCCFYEIGIIYMIFYVNEGNEEDYQIAKYYEKLLDEYSKFYLAINPYLKNYHEMLKEAENSVQNNTKQLVIKDFF